MQDMPAHRRHRQRGIEVGKEGAAARHFPFQRLTKARKVDFSNDQALLPTEMPGQSLGGLIRGRHMDVAIGEIDWRAVK